MSDADQLLRQIADLQRNRDAAGLAVLEDHADKAVRKAARKALHVLRAQGVSAPDRAQREWSLGDALTQLRGDLRPVVLLDTSSSPGGTYLFLSAADAEEGGTLTAALLDAEDRVLDFWARRQTDGQRQRMIRDWQRGAPREPVPEEWARARIRWARERTIAAGQAVPPALDELLIEFPPLAADDRPVATFLDAALAGQDLMDDAAYDVALVEAGAAQWPPLFDLEPLVQRVYELGREQDEAKAAAGADAEVAAADRDDELGRKTRTELMQQASRAIEATAGALRGPLANRLEDAAVNLWQVGNLPAAATMWASAKALRVAEDPRELPESPRILSFQVASLLRYLQRASAPDGAAGDDHDHHDHDHHAHDHPHPGPSGADEST